MVYQTARGSGKFHLSSIHPSGAGRKGTMVWEIKLGTSTENKKNPMKQNTLGNRITLEMPLYITLRHSPAQSTVQHGLKLLLTGS